MNNAVVYTVEEAAEAAKISRWKIFDLIRTNELRHSCYICRSRRLCEKFQTPWTREGPDRKLA